MRGFAQRIWAAFSFAAAMSVPAYGAPGLPSITIPVADGDFATDAALQGLMERLQLAARKVCKKETRDESGYLYARACYIGTMQDALAQLDRIRTRGPASVSAAMIVVGAPN